MEDYIKKSDVNRFVAKWISKPDGYSVVFNKCSFKKAIKYVLDKYFLKFGSKVFQHTIGIPMVLDPAPLIINLFLFYYRGKWIWKTKKRPDLT